ncbi:MAG: undecaprenyl-diphosphate phosphatase, partial [Clostridia bacterium]
AFVVKFFLPNLLTTKVLPIGFALTIVMIVLSQLLSKEKFGIENARPIPFIVTGIVQGIAVIPGLSRSGSTISVMRLFGLDSKSSANFSFLLSIPVILGSALVETIEVINTPVDIEWYCICAGVVCAFVSGILAVKAVIKIIAQKNFIWFAVYLIIPLTLSFIIL